MQPADEWLLCSRLRDLAAQVAATSNEFAADRLWQEMEASVEATRAGNVPEIWTPILVQDVDALQALIEGWFQRCRSLCPHDEAILERAMAAFRAAARKSAVGGRETGSGGVVLPPDGFPGDVWPLLVLRGALRRAGDGRYALARGNSSSMAHRA